MTTIFPIHSSESNPWLGRLQTWARELGFADLSISPAQVPAATLAAYQRWIDAGRQGSMDYMVRHAALRAHPEQLLPGALTVISVRLPYWPEDAHPASAQLAAPAEAYISRYALGRDYHKVVRQRLQKLADSLQSAAAPLGYRVCADSAPVLEVDFAQRGGLGWRGKHTLLLNRTGSWFFLGEILTDLPLPATPAMAPHCGQCRRCLDVCPTGAIVAPYEVDARRCISYLTIEHPGPIPEALRPALGNRIYGCDDCQLHCPWNRFTPGGDPSFAPRLNLDRAPLVELFAWSETEFLGRLEGSPIRRIGHERWLRNIATALGNAPGSNAVTAALASRADHPSPVVREHVQWALARHGNGRVG